METTVLHYCYLPCLVQGFGFGRGCLSLVFSSAIAAAACWAFLIEGPVARYSSVSPSFRHTVKFFLWEGPEKKNIVVVL